MEVKRHSRPVIGINTNYYKDPAQSTSRVQCQIGFTYVEAIRNAGGIPLLIPPIPEEGLLEYYIKHVSGFLFVGGPDYHPKHYGQKKKPETNLMPWQRSETDFALAHRVLKSDIPILGICAGHQLLSIVHGGKLIQHIPQADAHNSKDGKRNHHWVTVAKDGLLAGILRHKRLLVNSSHHQAVDPEGVGAGLKVVANALDGTIEAVEADDGRFILGIQWHPEGMPESASQRAIFKSFIAAASKR